MKIYLNKLKDEKTAFWYLVDFFMILLIITNLFWMGFDMAFYTKFFRAFVYSVNSSFFNYYYSVIHPDFMFYDMFFVALFLTEFVARWAYSVYENKLDKWYLYPFFYWYDLVGCIPLQAFRFLRLIRIFTLVIRLQKKGVIDIRETSTYKISMKYYYIMVEEIADRVTVNIISGTQDELRAGSPLVEKVIAEVILPQKEVIAGWAAERVKYASASIYADKKDEIRAYIASAVKEAVENSDEISDLEKVPILGKQISKKLEHSIGDITSSVIEKSMLDLAYKDTTELISEIIEVSLKTLIHPSEETQFEETTKEMAIASLELVKDQVKIKRWKEKKEL